jgi:hypothetical protein
MSMHFYVVALQETVGHLGYQKVSINVLCLAGCSDSEFIGLRDDKTPAA